MTIEEMHASILLKIDRVGSYATSNLISGEIDDFINDAVNHYVDQQRNIIRKYRYNERGMEAQENLRTVINRSSSTNLSTTSALSSGGWEVALNEFSDFDYFISGTVTTTNDEHILRHVSSSYLTDKARGKHLNFFNRGIPMSVESSKIIGFIPRNRSTVPDSINIAYLDYPDEVDLNSSAGLSLPDHTHRDIVEIAANKILQSLSGQEISSQSPNNQSE